MRQILLAGEETQKWAALLCDVVADRPGQHRVAGFERVQDRALGHSFAFDLQADLMAHARQRPQVRRKHDADHGRLWTSTDSTAGRSWTMAFQLSPASAEQ